MLPILAAVHSGAAYTTRLAGNLHRVALRTNPDIRLGRRQMMDNGSSNRWRSSQSGRKRYKMPTVSSTYDGSSFSMSESGQCLDRETQADSPLGRFPLFAVSRLVKKMTFGTGSTEK